MLKTREDVDQFLFDFMGAFKLQLNHYYNCSRLSSHWKEGSVNGNLTIIFREFPEKDNSVII